MDLDDTVEVPDTECPLTPTGFDLLKQEINPLEPCDNHGISLYTTAKVFVDSVL